MAVIKYRDWLLETDKEQNEHLHRQVELSGTQICKCEICKYFDTISSRLFPDEVKALCEDLGIDTNKNIDVSDLGNDETGHLYYGKFHFAGKLIDGKDCNVLSQYGGYTIDLLPISGTFKIGFTKIISQPVFGETENLVQLEFMVREF